MDDGISPVEVNTTLTISNDIDRMMEAVDCGWAIYSSGGRPGEVKKAVSSLVEGEGEMALITDMVLTRKRSREKFSSWERLYFTSSGLRWATPEVAADHCAERMSCERIADLACGQGGQIIAFASTCSGVVAIDKDPLNLSIARMNCIAMEAENVELICGDSLSEEVSRRVGKFDHVFCDPARPPGSKERTLSELLPDPREVMRAYAGKVRSFCFEVPPYLSLDKIPFPCETEYISIDGRINRLNLYTGDLARSSSSAVILPGGEVLSGEPRPIPAPGEERGEMNGYLYELDPALVKAGLVWMVAGAGEDARVLVLDERRAMLNVWDPRSSPFYKGEYVYLGSAADISTMIEMLRGMGAGSVTLRWKLDPADYWSVRNSIESKLDGQRKVQVFRLGGRYLVAEKIKRVQPSEKLH